LKFNFNKIDFMEPIELDATDLQLLDLPAGFVLKRCRTGIKPLHIQRMHLAQRLGLRQARMCEFTQGKLHGNTRNELGIHVARALRAVDNSISIPYVILSLIKTRGVEFVVPEPVMVAAVRVVANLTCCTAGTKLFLQVHCICFCLISTQSFFIQNGL
jgi:hypothetical protein